MEPRSSEARCGPMEPEFPDGTRWSLTWIWNRMGPTELGGPEVEQCSRKLGGGGGPLVHDLRIHATIWPKKGPGRPKGTR